MNVDRFLVEGPVVHSRAPAARARSANLGQTLTAAVFVGRVLLSALNYVVAGLG